MKVLVFNTAFREAQIGFQNEDKIVLRKLDSSIKHAESVLPQIDNILNGISVKDLDVVATVTGPGSFTGLRIGVALAKGFLSACPKLKAVAINSLDLMAFEFLQNNKPTSDFWCVINALSGNYFVSKYSKNGENIVPSKLANGEELEKIFEQDVLSLKEDEICESKYKIELTCEQLLNYTLKKIQDKDFIEEEKLNPLYLRKSQAEDELERKEKKNAN